MYTNPILMPESRQGDIGSGVMIKQIQFEEGRKESLINNKSRRKKTFFDDDDDDDKSRIRLGPLSVGPD